MGLIHDMTAKIKAWGETVRVFAPAEKLYCRICGRQYVSRGKHDIGICRECEALQNAHLVGGPLDGETAHDEN